MQMSVRLPVLLRIAGNSDMSHVRIVVNGQERDVPVNTTIEALLLELEIAPTGVAVALDRKVVPRSSHRQRVLKNGAVVEIIRAVGGG